MGKLYDRARNEGFGTRGIPFWEKSCPDCGTPVDRDAALAHLTVSHGAMFRVEPWIREKGMPEETFDELLAFVRKLKPPRTPETPHAE